MSLRCLRNIYTQSIDLKNFFTMYDKFHKHLLLKKYFLFKTYCKTNASMMDIYSLSLMVLKVHWSFLKKGCFLISSMPFRPRRTSLPNANIHKNILSNRCEPWQLNINTEIHVHLSVHVKAHLSVRKAQMMFLAS